LAQSQREMRVLVAALLICAADLGLAAEMRASDLFGKAVANAQGDSIGAVSDIIFDARDGAIRYVEVEHGGWLGLGDRAAAVPARLLTARGDVLTLQAGTRLESMPVQRRVIWPDIAARKLIHREVQDRRHRDSGEIVDVLIDLDAGHASAALVDLRDDWKSGRRVVRVPIEDFSLPRDMGRYATLNTDRERLLSQSE
jgi:sporulation protein YlmC with PRC-barrel domain